MGIMFNVTKEFKDGSTVKEVNGHSQMTNSETERVLSLLNKDVVILHQALLTRNPGEVYSLFYHAFPDTEITLKVVNWSEVYSNLEGRR